MPWVKHGAIARKTETSGSGWEGHTGNVNGWISQEWEGSLKNWRAYALSKEGNLLFPWEIIDPELSFFKTV